jgi:hypothetical protein
METCLKRSLPWFITTLIVTGCSQLDSILYSPRQTPETWLSIQPFSELHIASRTIILMQPSTTAIVYLLGIVAVAAGMYFLRIQNSQQSRRWWGIALLFWGIGALLAGTSYEAFSYQIKCAGRDACVWTSCWEIFYLIFSVASVDAMLIAQAYSCTIGKRRKMLTGYALINMALYTITVLIGVLIPVKFLISFELLLVVTAPNIIIFFILNGARYYRLKKEMDLVLLGVWGWLAVTIGAYFLYLLSGLTQKLWAEGMWFSENDVLHIGLIIWMVFIARIAARRIVDEPAALINHKRGES